MIGTGDTNGRPTRGLIGFYTSCTVFGIAITITAVSWIVFPTMGGAVAAGWFGVVLAVLSAGATWYFLGATRRER